MFKAATIILGLSVSFNLYASNLEYCANPEKDLLVDRICSNQNFVTNYTSLIFDLYDLDQSETLSFSETSQAFQSLKSSIKVQPEVKNGDYVGDDAFLKSLLTYSVKYGRQPKIAKGRPTAKFVRHRLLCGEKMESDSKECSFEAGKNKITDLIFKLTNVVPN